MMALLNFGHVTSVEQQVSASEVPWKYQRMSATSTIDSGSHAITVRCAPPPEFAEVLEKWYERDAATVAHWVKMIEDASDPATMIKWILNATTQYSIEVPMIKFVDISSLRIARGTTKKDLEDTNEHGLGELVPNPIQMPWLEQEAVAGHDHSIMFMDSGYMAPPTLLWQLHKIGDQLLKRLLPAHEFSVNRIIEIMTAKVRAKMTGEDLYSRLTSEYHTLLLATTLIQSYSRSIIHQPKSTFNSGGDPYKRLYTYAVIFELIKELERLLTMDITFLRGEVQGHDGIGGMQAPDRFKAWLQACSAFSDLLKPYFRNIPVMGMIYGQSAARGNWSMFMTPSWERIQYMTSSPDGGGSYIPELAMLEMNGFSSDIVAPVAVANRGRTDYRSTRAPESLGVEITAPLHIPDASLYAELKEMILMSNTTKKLDPEILYEISLPQADLWSLKKRAKNFERKVLPLRGSMFSAGLVGLDPPVQCSIQITADLLTSVQSPALLEGMMYEIPHTLTSPAEQVPVPWRPRL